VELERDARAEDEAGAERATAVTMLTVEVAGEEAAGIGTALRVGLVDAWTGAEATDDDPGIADDLGDGEEPEPEVTDSVPEAEPLPGLFAALAPP
jgi:hypothetical protein